MNDLRRSTFLRNHVPNLSGRVMIAGAKIWADNRDWRAIWPHGFGIDQEGGTGVSLVHDMEQPLPASIEPFDAVVCMSVLEHARRPWLVAGTVEAALRRGGTIYVSVPAVWRFHAYPHDYWRFLAGSLPILFPAIEWQTVLYEDRNGTLREPPRLPRPKDGRSGFGHIMLHGVGQRS